MEVPRVVCKLPEETCRPVPVKSFTESLPTTREPSNSRSPVTKRSSPNRSMVLCVPVPIFTPPPPGSIVKSSPEESVLPDRFNVPAMSFVFPFTSIEFSIVVVPDVAPIVMSVAAPPILSVLTPELTKLKSVEVLVISPPFASMFPKKLASS